jgi:hypothetical protein
VVTSFRHSCRPTQVPSHCILAKKGPPTQLSPIHVRHRRINRDDHRADLSSVLGRRKVRSGHNFIGQRIHRSYPQYSAGPGIVVLDAFIRVEMVARFWKPGGSLGFARGCCYTLAIHRSSRDCSVFSCSCTIPSEIELMSQGRTEDTRKIGEIYRGCEERSNG